MDAPTKTRVERGDELELTVDSLAFGGAGVARRDGYVVFVRDAIPGDTRARGGDQAQEGLRRGAHRRAARARRPSASTRSRRTRAPRGRCCPTSARSRSRPSRCEDALQRIGRLEGYELEPLVPAVEQWRYRNKLEYSFGTVARRRARSAASTRRARGSSIEHVEDCLLASEAGNEARRAALRWCRERGLGAYDRRAQIGLLRNLVVREGRRTGELQVRIVTSDEAGRASTASPRRSAPAASCGRARSTSARPPPAARSEVLHGTEAIEEELGGLRFRISADAFFQTNTEMAERLYGLAAEYAGLQGWERVYDLFCGIGTIGLSLAPRAGEVWGLEIVEEAIADAIANARRNEIDNARFFAGDVRLALRQIVETSGRPDVLVVDPPRSGLSAKIVRRVIEAAPTRIVYVSCNPTTLAPNAAQLVEAGYALRRVRPVDMFPQTPHIECVALLERA